MKKRLQLVIALCSLTMWTAVASAGTIDSVTVEQADNETLVNVEGSFADGCARDIHELRAGDDQDPFGRNQVPHVVHGHRQHRFVTDQGQNLLGVRRGAQRPEPFAFAARHDHCKHVVHR